MEEYLLSIIVQSDASKELFEILEKNLSDYKFLQEVFNKITEKLRLYFKSNENFESKTFVKNLPSELTEGFDKIFLFPIPKFEDLEKQKQEVEEVSKELRKVFLKGKLKTLSEKLRNTKEEKDKDLIKTEILQTTSKLSKS